MLVVVTGVLTGSLGSGQLLSSGSLSLRVQVLNLGLTEDAGEGLVGRSHHIQTKQDGTYIQVLLLGER